MNEERLVGPLAADLILVGNPTSLDHIYHGQGATKLREAFEII